MFTFTIINKQFNILVTVYNLATIQWESLASEKFDKFTLIEQLAKMFGKLIDRPRGY